MSRKETTVRVVTSSEIARIIKPPHDGGDKARIFGKIFEEEYTKATYYYERGMGFGRRVTGCFIRSIAWRVKEASIYDKDLIVRAFKMYSTLAKGGIVGRKPKTSFKKLGNGVFIAAQPDLEDDNGYSEFKTYPLDDYARTQSKVFSWVLEEPVHLVGLVENKDGRYEIQEEIVNGSNFEFPSIPANIGTIQEACAKCGYPLHGCKCASYRSYKETSEDEDFDDEDDDLF